MIHQIEANEPGIIIEIVLTEFFLSVEQIHRKIQFLKIFTDDVIVCLPDQKWSQSSNSVIRGLNKSVLYNFIMGRLSLTLIFTKIHKKISNNYKILKAGLNI